ncbi:hypothetical protein H113_02833 [Trichophyton rubrum MR1459]|uniref:Amino acid permease/ SLC12A domain-containing protein n=1 Tax=Trichophyton rubrum (strain ATCC MYA-4607 / CBS 118892) TaxID=559305 RepID=F2SSJ9_TRIRC|nr:uncharacterized protein TERG_05453 [Trichophyton rubrum CBS 118892]EGD89209.2 hypothetical protein TERG_05453 [Trichophyton rubrum CBS 118892]EZF86274.1 hypothetical protein H110_02831 [Trichophyton rubrum MR1448]EZF97003.1 hypothetical protein H113_02833 [Trichophyton rubrum MR1459]EZG08175.1 hypothetical protein H106_02659 [Trichophyton rubrum CBS 735.88]
MMFFIGILLPYDDKRLLSSGSKTAQSPLTIALSDAGILPAAHLINGLIVISVISAGNSSLYVASRTILYMGRSGKAPAILGRTNKAGVPWVALLFTNLVACISFLSLSSSAGKLYSALITLSGGTNPQRTPVNPAFTDKFSPSVYIHRLGCHSRNPHSFPTGPLHPRRRYLCATIPSYVLPLGNIYCPRSKHIFDFLPGIHRFPPPI